MSARYQFLPWVRVGAANAYLNTDTLRPTLSRPDGKPLSALPVLLKINDRPPVDVALRLYGPSDVVGIDPRTVIRTDPPRNSADLEPNYLACIEFDTPDFPWMFTPATAATQGRLRPWVCLVVVRRGDTGGLTFSRERALPALTADVAELPDLGESWYWAHAQVVQADAAEPVDRILAAEPQRNLSRLICPRRLEPQTRYLACVVPAFDAGRRAGLGLEVTEAAENALAPAWEISQTQVELPVYYHWEFATGAGGDFESLAALLEGRDAGDAGRRSLRVQSAPFVAADAGQREFQGPLLPVGTAALKPAPVAFQEELRTLLNTASPPVVTPPVYGSWQASVPAVPDTVAPPRWLRQLNLDPAARAAAGLGVRVVQEHQEQLVASAWEQLGDADGVARLERRLEAGVALLESVVRRHVETMDTGRMLQLLGPAQARMLTSSETLQARLERNGLPTSFSSASFRRTLRPAGTLSRRRSPGPPSLALVASTVQMAVPAVGPAAGTPALVATEHLQVHIDFPETPGSLPAISRYMSAMAQARAYANSFGGDPTPLLGLPWQYETGGFREGLVTALAPREPLTRRFYSRVSSGGAAVAPPPAGSVLPQPSFPQPMYEGLRDLSPELLLPGVGEIPANTVTVLESNARFIEAYMAGLNHEIASELQWREFPGDLRHTYFRTFWDPGGAATQSLPLLHTWNGEADLGMNFTAVRGQLVLLIRGELLRRYPDALIYAVPAKDPITPDTGQGELLPTFRGRIDPDITFVGFPLTETQARTSPGWFFVIQEQPSAPRFGLDETSTRIVETPPKQVPRWDDVAWTDTRVLPGARVKIGDLTLPAALRPPAPTWAFNAAHMAGILRQRPVRVAFHVKRLLPPVTP